MWCRFATLPDGYGFLFAVLQEVAERICLGSPKKQRNVSHIRGQPVVETPLRWGMRTWAPDRELINGKPSTGAKTPGVHQPPEAITSLGVSGKTGGVANAGGVRGGGGGGTGGWGQQRVTGIKESKKKDTGEEAADRKTTGAGSLRHSFRSKHWYS